MSFVILHLHCRYIDSHESVNLNQSPNFDYLGQPINSYFLIRHVALGWNEIRTKVFDAENATRRIFGECDCDLRGREEGRDELTYTLLLRWTSKSGSGKTPEPLRR